MAGTRYVPITFQAFNAVMDTIGAQQVFISGCWEHVWDRPVITNSGAQFKYNIRIFSSVDVGTDVTRDKGKDAIRIALYNTATERCVGGASKRVFRTKNALDSVVLRARAMFGEVINPEWHCPCCGAFMVIRNGRNGDFKGCTRYPVCRGTKEL